MNDTENNEKALLKKISELESELKKIKKQKKYGLVWEDKPEQIVEDCKRNVPILRLKETKKGIDPVIVTDKSKDENILIEGDNYHALSVLNYTHKEKVDFIYIDPPYNTGNKDFKYNDNYVDKEDSFRHSKWISFMENRLSLSRNLLSDKGIIAISIDDNEQAQLKLLCNGIFGESNFIAQIAWRRTDNQPNIGSIARVKEYIIVYSKSKNFSLNKVGLTDRAKKEYRYEDTTGKFRRSNLYDKTRGKYIYKIKSPSGKILSGPWMIEEADFYKLLENNSIYWASGVDESPYGKIYLNNSLGQIPNDFLGIEFGTNQEAGIDLQNIFGKRIFDFPKPLSLIEHLISITTQKNSIILDYFAGSGTTGHSVLNLNKKDESNRKFILCTDNENNICEEVTYERIKRVIKGYTSLKGEKVEGLDGNLRYYKTGLVDIEKLHHTPDQAKIKLTYQAGEMVGLRENTLSEVEKNEWWQIFEGHGKTTAIYFKEDKEELQDLVDLLEKKKQQAVLYIFSWGKNEYKSEYSSANIRVEDIPEPILEVYKEINRL